MKYDTFEDFKNSIIKKSEVKILAKNNIDNLDNKTLVYIDLLFEEAIETLIEWRKLKDNIEFFNGAYDKGIINYIFTSYYSYGNDTYASISGNSGSYVYKENAVEQLKKEYSQRLA